MWPFKPKETRASLENPAVSLADPSAWQSLFQSWQSVAGIDVNPDRALTVPAVWCGTNFISGTIAALPLQLFRKDEENRELAKADPLYSILHDVVNEDGLTSFKWRKGLMASTLLTGRSYTFIERNKAGRVMNLWPLDPAKTTPKRINGRTFYDYKDGDKSVTYEAGEIIDIPFLLKADGLGHYSPTERLKNALGLAIAMEEYASRFFLNGGVPPLAMQGPTASPAAITRAAGDIQEAVRQAHRENKNVLYMPTGHELKAIGFDPDKGQLVEARRFQVEEVARVYNLPPVFLQDLTHGTYSNTEQQDLHVVKHLLTQWVELIEQELNAKLFSRRNRQNFVEFNLDGLLRGDFKTRMEGYAQGVQNGVLTPNEVRRAENRPDMPEGDKLYIQGATVPLGSQPAAADPAQEGNDDQA